MDGLISAITALLESFDIKLDFNFEPIMGVIDALKEMFKEK